jgi:hypothetical protein
MLVLIKKWLPYSDGKKNWPLMEQEKKAARKLALNSLPKGTVEACKPHTSEYIHNRARMNTDRQADRQRKR